VSVGGSGVSVAIGAGVEVGVGLAPPGVLKGWFC
jgi:hypothetical protein